MNSQIIPQSDPQNQSIAIYQTNDLELPFRVVNDDVYGSQREIAVLFGISVNSVQKHAENFKAADPETYAKGVEKIYTPSTGGPQAVTHYNLDIITYIGYRAQATPETIAFRKWVASLVKKEANNASVGPLMSTGEYLVAQAQAMLALEQKVASHDRRFDKMDEAVGGVMQTVDKIVDRLDDKDYFTVWTWCITQRIEHTLSLRQRWTKAAQALSHERGLAIHSVIENSYPAYSYHQSVLLVVCVPKPTKSNQLTLDGVE